MKIKTLADGAVVSREIVKKPAGNVTLFAFDEGQGLSEHMAQRESPRRDAARDDEGKGAAHFE